MVTSATAITMRAVLQPRYGGAEVLRYEEVPCPTLGPNEVLVRVEAASVCKGDVHLLTGKPYLIRLFFGLRRPRHRIAGQDIAGTVVAVGAAVRDFVVGDDVYGPATSGGFAEFVAVPTSRLARKPQNLTFDEAAAMPDAGLTALQGLRDVGRLQAGQRVLINGASGGVGTMAVQIAKALGAHVTAVCSTRHVDALLALGADEVIDYTREDFARRGPVFDVLFDLVANRTVGTCCSLLTPRGTYVSSAGNAGGNWVGPLLWLLSVVLTSLFVRQTLRPLMMQPTAADLQTLGSWLETGAIEPVIEQVFTLSDAARAVAHVAEGHARGKTVLRVRRE